MTSPKRGHSQQAPSYEIPRLDLAFFGVDLVLGRRRSFARDAQTVMQANEDHPRIIDDVQNAPAGGVFVLVMNHYSRAGLRPYHCAMAVSAALAARRPGQPEIRWAITSEYQGRRAGPLPLPLWLIRWTFRRVARAYGFVVLPRREELVMARAAALRQLRRLLESAPVGLTPEGEASSGRLVEPPAGNGLFLASLTRRDVALLPVGVWEDGGALHVRFGAPFQLAVPRELARAEQDRLARDQTMVAIGRLLPREFRGAYEASIRG